jgi:hypothetical protein
MTPITQLPRSWWTLACLLLLAAAAPAATAGVKNGVSDPTGSDPVTHTGPRAASVVGEVLIDFDDVPAPCEFIKTVPLRDLYLPLGVRFSGLDALSGGAVLNACSSFDVFGYSGDNFLAFNELAVCSNGGVPATPETIDFTSQVSVVSMLVGSAENTGATVSLDAFDAANTLVGSNSRGINAGLQPLGVSGVGIVRVVLHGPSVLVVDDLRFTPGGVVGVASHSWGRLKALYR